MKRYKITVQYDGTDFCGWQYQPNGISVQECLTNAFLKISESASVTASGRTDSGVHARGAVCHVDLDTTTPTDKIAKAVNCHLPDSIAVLSAEEVSEDFHARYSAKRKTYVYHFYVSEIKLPLKERYSVRLDKMPDIDLMKKGAEKIVGKHDFKCFLASGSSVENTEREIYSLTVEQSGIDISVKVCGNGFLYNMVRIIAGTLLDVGYKRKSAQDVENAIREKDRNLSGKTLPAKGLELFSVEYI